MPSHRPFDHGPVLGPADGARARAGGHAQLRRRARPRAGVAPRGGRAPAQRDGRLDGLGHPAGLAGGRQRPQVEGAVVAHRAHHRQAGEGLGQGQLEVGVARPVLGLAVEAGLVLVDEPDLAHRGLEGARADLVVDGLHLAQQLGDLAAGVAREVRAHPAAQVGGLAHVQHPPAPVAEQVDARLAGQRGGEPQLGGLGVAGDGGQGHQVVEPGHAQPGRPLQQDVEQVGGGQRVVEGAVAGPVVEAEATRQRAQLAVGHLVAHQAPGQGAGVDRGVGQRRALGAHQRGPDEAQVEADVVADHHRVADELEQAGQHRLDARGGHHHGLGDAGQHRDLGWHGRARG